MFVIKHATKGYLMNDEDLFWSYSHEINEYTIVFTKKEIAELNCDKDEVVIEIN